MAEQSAHDVVNSTQSMGEPASVDETGKSLKSSLGGGGESLKGAEVAGELPKLTSQDYVSNKLASYGEDGGPNGVTTTTNSVNHASNVIAKLRRWLAVANSIPSMTD